MPGEAGVEIWPEVARDEITIPFCDGFAQAPAPSPRTLGEGSVEVLQEHARLHRSYSSAGGQLASFTREPVSGARGRKRDENREVRSTSA
jgi:hypothetical protein